MDLAVDPLNTVRMALLLEFCTTKKIQAKMIPKSRPMTKSHLQGSALYRASGILDLQGHADCDGPDGDVLHAVDPISGIPYSLNDQVDTEDEDEGTDDHHGWTQVSIDDDHMSVSLTQVPNDGGTDHHDGACSSSEHEAR